MLSGLIRITGRIAGRFRRTSRIGAASGLAIPLGDRRGPLDAAGALADKSERNQCNLLSS
jgi:hypothetical protein